MKRNPFFVTVAALALASALASAEEAAEAAPTAASASEAAAQAAFVAHNAWMLLCTGLVFLMHLGFATLESGLSRSKNTVNILFKNVFIVCIGLLTYYLVGFNLMYPGDFNGYFGFAGFPLDPGEGKPSPTTMARTPIGPTSSSKGCSRPPARRSFPAPLRSGSS
jgi:hypothetical protein